MKSAATVFLVAFAALSASWAGFVLAPQFQLGQASQAASVPRKEKYPIARPGLAQQGAEVYRSLGCVYCHSQQVVQEGVKAEVFLTDAGTNATATLAALEKLNSEFGKPEVLTGLPRVLMTVPDVPSGIPITKAIADAGAKAETRVTALGPDVARGWGKRRSLAQDYVYDATVQPGVRRFGPDLANEGLIKADVNWQLRHLYAPASEVKASTMPPYRFLFEQRRIGEKVSPDALQLTGEFAPPTGFEVVPTEKARALAAYLVSLRQDTPIFEGPFTAPPKPEAVAPTNAPVAASQTAVSSFAGEELSRFAPR